MRLLWIPLVLVIALTGACGGGSEGGGGSNIPGGGGGGGGGGGDTDAPSAFRFTDITGQAVGTVVTSNAVTVSGTGSSWPISVTGGSYSIGCGATFTSSSGTINKGSTVCVRHTTSSANSTRVDTTLTIGGVSDTFSSTTVAGTVSPLTKAAMHRGTISRDAEFAIINAVFSVLDADGNPVSNLDGGAFRVRPEGAVADEPEMHHDAQKLDYPAQVSGGIVLMLDVSDSMGPRFAELKAAAKRLVSEAAASGLPVTVYAFDVADRLVGEVAGGADPTALNASIDALALGSSHTYFYSVLKNRVTLRLGINGVAYTHVPLGTPTAHVELMVIMSDGRDNSGTSSLQEIQDAKAGAYSLITIPVGDNPDTSGLKEISEFQFITASGDTYSDTVDTALARIQNYYRGLYVVDVAPTVIEGTDAKFVVTLVGNDTSMITVLYHPDDARFKTRPNIPSYCCRLRMEPSGSMSPVSLASNSSVTFRAVQLWTVVQPTFTWTLNNAAGRLTMTPSADSTSARVNSIGGSTTGTIEVEDPVSGWTGGPVTISVP